MADSESAENSNSEFDNYEESLEFDDFEENLKIYVISNQNCIKNQQKLESQISKKSNDYDRLRSSLDNTYEKMKELRSSYEDFIEDYNSLLKNNPSVEFLDRDSEERKRLESELEKTNGECCRLKSRFEAAEEELTKTTNLLQAEKILREQVEIERDSLTRSSEKLWRMFLKYEQHFSSTDRIIVTNALANGKSTTELDTVIDCESEGTDWILEVRPSPSKSIVNDEIQDAQTDVVSSSKTENYSDSVQEESSSVPRDISLSTSSSKSSKTNTSEGGESFLKKTYLRRHLRKHKSNQSSDPCKQNVQSVIAENTRESQSQRMANGKRTYNTRGSKVKPTLMNDESLLKHVDRSETSETVINFSSQHKNLRCEICKGYYSSKQSLYKHKRLMHGKEKPHKCSKCDKTFTLRHHLKIHESTHSTRRPFRCSICNKSFKNSSHKTGHEKTIHGDGGVYCAYCDKKFTRKRLLVGHILKEHVPDLLEKPYKCPTCGKAFFQKQHLNQHLTVHLSKRSHKCSMCDKCFKSNHYKLLHERNTHAEGFRFNCEHCIRGFRSKKGLWRHVQNIHS